MAFSAEMEQMLNKFESEKGITTPVSETNTTEPQIQVDGQQSAQTTNDTTPAAAPVTSVSEDVMLKWYNEKFGTSFKTVQELEQHNTPKPAPKPKTKEEIAEEEEAERREALQWALENKKFKQEDYDKHVIDKSKSPRQIALEVFSNDYKEINPNADASEIEDAFKEEFGEEESENSFRRKIGQKRIAELANGFLKNYETIEKNVDNYREYKTLSEKAKTFKAQVKSVLDELPKEMSFSIPVESLDAKGAPVVQNYDYKLALTPEMTEKLRKVYLEKNTAFETFGAAHREVKNEQIANAAMFDLKSELFDTVVAQIAKEHGQRVKMETLASVRGIPNRQPAQNMPAGVPAPKANEFKMDEAFRRAISQY